MSPAADGNEHLPNEHLPFDMPENTSFYNWKGLADFLSVRDEEISRFMADQSGSASEYFVFLNLSNEIFNQHFADNNDYQFDADSYYVKEEALVIMVKSHEHETAHIAFHSILDEKLVAMGMNRNLMGTGSTTVKTNDRWKAPDASYRPLRLPSGRARQWPSLTVEVSVSESRTKLANDARWWLITSAGDVKNVITIYVRIPSKEITFEVWCLGSRESPIPQVTYRTVISRRDSDIDMSSQLPMTIPFENLFLRRAEGKAERDIQFDSEDMKYIADCVWDDL